MWRAIGCAIGVMMAWASMTGAQGVWLNLHGDLLNYPENDGLRIIDQGSDSEIDPAVVIADGARLVVTMLTDGHDCCAVNHGAGCRDLAIETAVCSVDPYCCTSIWDNVCVNQVETATANKYLCPDDYGAEALSIDANGLNGGHPDINPDCGDYVCHKATRLGTAGGGSTGRVPLEVVFNPSLDGGWGYPSINALVRSLLYMNSSDAPDTSISRSIEVVYMATSGATEAGTVSLSLVPVNDAPVVATNSALTVLEGSSASVDSTKLAAVDSDSSASEIFWTIRNGGDASHGALRATGVPAHWVRQTDISAGTVTYAHDGSETLSDALTFELTDTHNCCVDAYGAGCSDSSIEACVCAVDSYCCATRWDAPCVGEVTGACAATCGATAGAQAFNINVVPDNDPPVLVTNGTLMVSQGEQEPITSTHLLTIDPDSPASALVYTVVTAPANGELRLASTPATSFTQMQVSASLLAYRHDGSVTTNDSFLFTVTDGAGGFIGTYTFNIIVLGVVDPSIFADGFESGTVCSWSSQQGGEPCPGVPATGSMTTIAAADLVDGETFTLSDGFNAAAVFEFDTDGGIAPGATPVALSGSETADEVRDAITVTVNVLPALDITAAVGGNALVSLTNNLVGTAGNQPIAETVADAGFQVTGMSGGIDP